MKHIAVSVALLVLVPFARADEPKKFPAAKHNRGELKYIDKIPVLIVKGKPAEMGEQFGVLAIKNAPDIEGLHAQYLKDAGQEKKWPFIAAMAKSLKPGFPAHIATEVEAAAKASNSKEELLLFANTVADLTTGLGCSTVIAEKERSSTGKPIFGRIFDWNPTKGITEHTLVVIYKGEGKRAFAAVTISPIAGVISGMNDAGLCVTMNEIMLKQCKEKQEFNGKGMPMLLAFRRVLEECSTVEEAEKLLRTKEMERTSTTCMTICDKNGGAVFELTPKGVAVRKHENGVCCCTNHFRTEKLCLDDAKCPRYEKLAPLQAKDGPKLGVKEVVAALDKVNAGTHTLQCMVFEPSERVLHLSYGTGPATKIPLTKIDLGKLFDEK